MTRNQKHSRFTSEYILNAALEYTSSLNRTVSVRSLRTFILRDLDGQPVTVLDKRQQDSGLTGARISKVLMSYPEYFTPVYRTPHTDLAGYTHQRVGYFVRNSFLNTQCFSSCTAAAVNSVEVF